ncbi:MAG: pectate lyase, partial [Paludibacteraceae bacterium]|nr:pectate lyase [Paludibacteraceae bacterium]
KNASFHHNLLAHHDSRNPRFDHDYVDTKYAGPIDYVNNVIYNWGGNSTYGGEGTNKGAGGRHINMVNNYYKYGPATSKKTRLVDPTVGCPNCVDHPGGTVQGPKIYLTGNYMFGSTEVTNNNWEGSTVKTDAVKASTRWTDGLTSLENEQTAEAAYETVLAKAGCSLHRDAVDSRIVEEVRNGNFTYTGSNGSRNGLIDTQSDVGGWPELQPAERPLDTDYDGIPDEWENQFGLNPADPNDARTVTLVTGHTNLDVYLCHLVRNLYR